MKDSLARVGWNELFGGAVRLIEVFPNNADFVLHF
jgi:hypothetical protein